VPSTLPQLRVLHFALPDELAAGELAALGQLTELTQLRVELASRNGDCLCELSACSQLQRLELQDVELGLLALLLSSASLASLRHLVLEDLWQWQQLHDAAFALKARLTTAARNLTGLL